MGTKPWILNKSKYFKMRILMNMDKIILACFCVVLLTQCKPYEIPFEKFASIAVTHTSPGTGSADVLVDGKVTSIARIVYNGSTRTNAAGNSVYLPVLVGNRAIMFLIKPVLQFIYPVQKTFCRIPNLKQQLPW